LPGVVRVARRICFVGDSFVNGTGDDACLGWSGRVCAAARRAGHDVTFYNLGIRRETSADVAARWAQEVATRLPDAEQGRLVFSFGTNDATAIDQGTRLQPEQSVANLQRILETATTQFQTLVVGPPPSPDPALDARVAMLSERFADVCQTLAVPYLPVHAALTATGTWCAEASAGDGAHPNERGYHELARLVQAWSAWQAWFVPIGALPGR
jgi:lysophospholipase L1-like esterase